ncbi:MAG TPA: LuxR C-terminal-related transcriptional regulator [Bacteroidia bacterium]
MSLKETSKYFEDLQETLKKRKPVKESFSSLAAMPLAKDQALYVLDFRKKELVFQKGIREFLGYSPEEFTLEKVTSYYHPEDYEIINRLLRASIAYAAAHTTKTNDVALFVTGRIQHKNGEYIKTLRQSTVFEKDAEGRMLSNVSIISDISFIDMSDKVNWKFVATGLDEKKFRSYVTIEYKGFFSDREIDVLRLLPGGQSSLEIANSLHISKHTVDGHRRSMLRKSNCKNTVELINFAKTNGIL